MNREMLAQAFSGLRTTEILRVVIRRLEHAIGSNTETEACFLLVLTSTDVEQLQNAV